ncbi:uncharacterized protein PGTG_20650 [Puccinia graminis f. sp. tritici CRL 75-36-700-3]|uniref:Altered inheritance of mitochondria protein 41 n=1 Tax=Puccinia graminis f. sp. tritici (strain CRL 75-36-700-3 / race SCCL) TaxID=418459 RepID=H6QPB7_PUCGT|nr:uncharacterized protein PGTG_20650 [Puccinia graminis f. sp. tritici CRL 75-36-700-3]EHS63552.1 hypothetical protein PGTG_20650 [Puccinia graminis f. sp. tritici CRL 75-36-700-3]
MVCRSAAWFQPFTPSIHFQSPHTAEDWHSRRFLQTTEEMGLARNGIGLRNVISRHLARDSNVSPLPYLSRPWASKSSVSYFSSSNSTHSDSVEKGPDDLIASLRADLKNSMKIKDLTQRDVIKSLLGDLQNSEHNKNRQTHEKVVHSAIKKRLEAAKISLESNPPRLELNKQNLQEVEILKKYLTFFSSSHSAQDSNEEALTKAVNDSIQQLGLSPDATQQERQNSLGKLIKSVKDKVDSNFDNKDIANAVRKALGLC